MEILYSLLFLVVILLIVFEEAIFGLKCPICGSRKHWEKRTWGSNKDYEEDFCMNCYKAMYSSKSGEVITFKSEQNWK